MESISRTKGSDFGRELEIVNGAGTRWVEEKEWREKEMRKKEKGREAIFYRRVTPWWLSWLSHSKRTGATQSDVAPHRHQPTRLLHESRHTRVAPAWLHNSKGSDLKNKFRLDSFLNFFKKSKKNPWSTRVRSLTSKSGSCMPLTLSLRQRRAVWLVLWGLGAGPVA
jgi:hypothetical protein